MTHLWGVVPEPVVRLPEVVKDDSGSVAAAGWEDDGGRGVRLRRHPRAVERVHDQEGRHDQHHAVGNLKKRSEKL